MSEENFCCWEKKKWTWQQKTKGARVWKSKKKTTKIIHIFFVLGKRFWGKKKAIFISPPKRGNNKTSNEMGGKLREREGEKVMRKCHVQEWINWTMNILDWEAQNCRKVGRVITKRSIVVLFFAGGGAGEICCCCLFQISHSVTPFWARHYDCPTIFYPELIVD